MKFAAGDHRLLGHDLRDCCEVGPGVEAAVAGLGDLLEQRRRALAGREHRHRDAVLLEQLGRPRRRVSSISAGAGEAVGEQDDVLELGVARVSASAASSSESRMSVLPVGLQRSQPVGRPRRPAAAVCRSITHSALEFHASTPTSSISDSAAIVRSAAARRCRSC